MMTDHGGVDLTMDELRGELQAGDDPAVGIEAIERARRRASPALVDALRRYPVAPAGRGRLSLLMATLDASLRDTR